MIEIVVLGCGTSHGVPMAACDCKVCQSDDPRNRRARSAILIRSEERTVLVDAPPELRLQLVRERVCRLDAVVLTHSHADHIMGLDDVRRFNELSGEPMPVYAQPNVLEDVRRVFRYAFVPSSYEGGGLPSFALREIAARQVVAEFPIASFEVMHGNLPVLGLRIGNFAYLTDVSAIPSSAEHCLKNLKTLILDATRKLPHPSHFHLSKAIETAQRIGAEMTYLTHLSHDYDYEETTRTLPAGISLSYDGLRFPISETWEEFWQTA